MKKYKKYIFILFICLTKLFCIKISSTIIPVKINIFTMILVKTFSINITLTVFIILKKFFLRILRERNTPSTS